jgi:hypothetical protein
MDHLIVETSFETPPTDADLSASARRIDNCLAAYGARWLRSYLSKDRRRMVCEFEAPDAEAVRSSYRSAGAEFERCWPAEVFTLDQSAAVV